MLHTQPSPHSQTRKRILMLHGNGQSGDFFMYKTKFLQNWLKAGIHGTLKHDSEVSYDDDIELFYATSPLPTRNHDICQSSKLEALMEQKRGYLEENDNMWTWGQGDHKTDLVTGLENSIEHIMDILNNHGPFIGVMGFSAGASLAAIIASLLERPKRQSCFKFETNHPPLLFSVCFSGFELSHPYYKAIYRPKIRTPVLHFIGTLDPIIPPSDTLRLVKRCQCTEVFYFPGTHHVPRTMDVAYTVAMFIKNLLKTHGEVERDDDDEWEDL
ncbi:hypothetical protein N7520_008457 [Penicillium odoratum]|uniref:uncharacterized protein n=1 Tax=Penicillium odoratum TaxID=1167516 RepID=UPI0025497D61|nr:uncharacterized protein N7520_008457 [Penicillium odoratum]KAJ5761301.1 hypothetical protein N7520_008457 [Penicillium odoratum]